MKFICDNCSTKYSIADERVRGRVLKIRCKKCDFVITVREDVQAAAAAMQLPGEDDVGRAFDAAMGGDNDQTMIGGMDNRSGQSDLGRYSLVQRGPVQGTTNAASEADDWYVSFDGEQEGPYSLTRAIERVKIEAKGGKEAHAWRPGFLVWLPVEEVPELQSALAVKQPALPPRIPVRATTPTPLGGGVRGAVSNQIAKDPSGPRAALSVGAGAVRTPTPSLGAARPELRKSGAPPIPSSGGPAPAIPSSVPAAGLGAGAGPGAGLAGVGFSGGSRPLAAAAASPASPSARAPMFAASGAGSMAAASSGASAAAKAEASPDLPISNEASGLVDIAHLRAAAFGKATGPAFVNGHTGRQRAVAPEPMSAFDDLPDNPSTAAPVVVVAGPAPGGAHPLFKWAALAGLVLCLGLGGGVWYLLTHRPEADTIIVTEPSRHVDDQPITVSDPVTGKLVTVDPKRVPPGARRVAAKAAPAATPNNAAPKPDGLSGSQRALADLYKDDGDRATPHDVAGGNRGGGPATQVSQASIMAAVNTNKRALNLCFDRALKHDSALKSGRVPIQVTVGISGRVTAVTIPEAQYASSELGQCFIQAVKRWTFPASDAPYSTEFPFILQGQ